MDKNTNGRVNRRQLLQTISTLSIGTNIAGVASATGKLTDKTIKYEDLTKEAKQVFELALTEGRSNEYQYNSFPTQLLEYEAIVYQGNQYLLNRTYRNKARYEITPETILKDKIDDSDEYKIIAFSDLNEDSAGAFLTGLREEKFERFGNFPKQFQFKNQYVLKEGEYYDLNFLHEDIPIFTISPSLN